MTSPGETSVCGEDMFLPSFVCKGSQTNRCMAFFNCQNLSCSSEACQRLYDKNGDLHAPAIPERRLVPRVFAD